LASHFWANCHPDRGGNALAEWAGGGLHSGNRRVFGVAGRLAIELAKAANRVQRHRRFAQPLAIGIHRLHPSEVKDGPEQHRGVPIGEDEAVAVGPDGVLRIVLQHPVPDRVDQRRQRHRRARMAGLRLLHGIDRERAYRVDRQLNCVFIVHWIGLGLLRFL